MRLRMIHLVRLEYNLITLMINDFIFKTKIYTLHNIMFIWIIFCWLKTLKEHNILSNHNKFKNKNMILPECSTTNTISVQLFGTIKRTILWYLCNNITCLLY